jgi:hypothetical protein
MTKKERRLRHLNKWDGIAFELSSTISDIGMTAIELKCANRMPAHTIDWRNILEYPHELLAYAESLLEKDGDQLWACLEVGGFPFQKVAEFREDIRNNSQKLRQLLA